MNNLFEKMTKDEKVQYLTDAFVALRASGKIKTWNDFAVLLPCNRSVLSSAKNGDEHCLTDNLLLKVHGLLTHGLPGVNISHSPHSNVATDGGSITIGTAQPDDQSPASENEMVPVIPMNLYKETDVNILEYLYDEENDVPMTPAVQQFPKTDAIYSVQTMAMYPHLHQGDLLALKAIKRTTAIVNGEMYAIDTVDNGIIIRFAYDRGDHIELRASL